MPGHIRPNIRQLFIGMIQEAPERLTPPLSVASAWIKGIHAEILELGKEESAERQGSLIDDACEELECAIGVCFVICQSSITRIVSVARRLATHEGQELKCKRHLLALGEKMPQKEAFSKVAVIDAFANYYKHRDEWVGWLLDEGGSIEKKTHSKEQRTPRLAKETVKLISKAGAKEGDSGNLRLGARVLGNLSYSDTIVFKEIIQDWSQRVVEDIRKTPPRRR